MQVQKPSKWRYLLIHVASCRLGVVTSKSQESTIGIEIFLFQPSLFPSFFHLSVPLSLRPPFLLLFSLLPFHFPTALLLLTPSSFHLLLLPVPPSLPTFSLPPFCAETQTQEPHQADYSDKLGKLHPQLLYFFFLQIVVTLFARYR